MPFLCDLQLLTKRLVLSLNKAIYPRTKNTFFFNLEERKRLPLAD